jgi:aerobic-type carbon monoxide dehydrogenase small subunit (CoxS/CutS family)
VRFNLNGKPVDVQAHAMKRLLDEPARTAGWRTKEAAVRVRRPAPSRRRPGGQLVPGAVRPVRGAKIVTIEGLRGQHPLQHAFVREGGSQCGICTPGMIMAAAALPRHATPDDVRNGLAGNICRCTGYSAIYRAVQAARSDRPSSRRPGRTKGAKRKGRR